MYYAGVYNVYYTFSSSFECEGGSHVKHMHAVSLDPTGFLLEINDLVTKFIRKFHFDPLLNCSKFHFRSSANK